MTQTSERPYRGGAGTRCLAYLAVNRLPAVRWATQKDLYQALLRGRAVITREFAEDYVIESAVDAAGLSSYYFQRLFKALFLETPHAYRTRQRIELAGRLLLETNLPVRTIAERCGYSSVATFTRTVHKHLGETPAEFRKNGQASLR